MLRTIYFLVLFVSWNAISQDQTTIWTQNFEEAKQKASDEKKSILMYFTGSDWCRPCKVLKVDFFDSSRFKSYQNSYVFLKIDIPRNQDLLSPQQKENNFKLLKEYNKEGSFPLVMIVSAKGKPIDQVSGYNSNRDPQEHFELLEKYK